MSKVRSPVAVNSVSKVSRIHVVLFSGRTVYGRMDNNKQFPTGTVSFHSLAMFFQPIDDLGMTVYQL